LNTDKNKHFAINNILKITNHTTVPIGVYIGQNAEYSINLTENNFDKVHIYLEDKQDNKYIDLIHSPNYKFNADNIGQITDRFVLHFVRNNPPRQTMPIEDQYTTVYEDWKYQIPEGTFVDADFGDELKLSATLENGEALPQWITFENGVFYGIPETPQTIKIKVTATDMFNESTSALFTLNVKANSTSIVDFAKETKIYPNPTLGIINVQLPFVTNNTTVKISDISGKIILEQKIISVASQINLSNLAKGAYFIEITNENTSFKRIIIIK
jgi:hypothetical protein